MACAWWGVSVGTLRLESFLLLVVWYGVYVVGRQRRYIEAGVFSSSGGLVWRVRGRPSALGTLRLGSFLFWWSCIACAW
jgi:hypothetical protein